MIVHKASRNRTIGKFYTRENILSDLIVIKEIWEEDVYHIEDKYLNNGGIVLDVGANIGSFSVYCAQKGAKVYAVEPEPHNLNVLYSNIELNNLSDKIRVFECGIDGYNGTAIISQEGGDSNILDEKEGVEIQVATFDRFVEHYGINEIDILKIDIEGSEKNLILKASKKNLQKCKYITMELDSRVGKHLGKIVQKLSETHHVRTMGSWERGGMIWGWIY